VSRTYAYNASGDLYTVTYNDGTPSVTYTYDRRGRQATVVRNSITTSLSFNEADRVLTESYSGGTLAGLSVNNTYNGYLQRDSVNIKNGSTVLQSASFGYDTAGRLSTVTDGAYSAAYAYEANSALIRSVTFTNTAAGGLVSSRAYDYLNRLTSISSVGYGSAASLLPVSYAYRYNAANQRTQATLGDGSYWVYQYDALGQVISGKRYWSDGTPVAGQQFQYGFDDIGNRKTTAAGGDAGGQNLRSATYTANYLNQYSSRTVPAYLDVLGLANPTATVTVNGNGTYRKGEYFQYALNIPNSTPQYPSITVSAQWGTTNQSSTGKAYVPATPENLGYDTDGNLTSDGRWSYTWDGENRLTQMIRDTDTPSGARQKLTFEYDWQGRRIRKKFYTYNSGWVLQSDLAFLYDGWLLMGELNAASSNDKVRTYVWGTDLSGSIGGAGGVGGLLKVTYYGSTTTNAFVSYDGNGNIVALVDGASGSFAARYEFGPFAEPIRASGPMAMADPIRWSSKYQDDESELSYYGWRFYNPGTGRWLNRDPIEEKRGGPNLCAFVVNNPLTYIDTHGREVYAYCPSCRMPISPFEPKPHVCPPKPPRPPQYPDGFAVCTRWIDEPGFIVNCINHCGGAHTYVQYATTPKPPETGPMYLWGRGFTKGGVETERKFNPSTCTRCKKSDESKSDAEIMDCISNHPPSKPYSWGMLFNKYVCKEWAWEAATACGLSCK
jgi:RHS repeat-associated protein